MLEYALESGLYTPSPMGNTPLSWQDIESYIRISGLEIPLEEVKIIREASVMYVRYMHLSKEDDCPCPFPDNDEQAKVERGDGIKAAVQQFKNKRQK